MAQIDDLGACFQPGSDRLYGFARYPYGEVLLRHVALSVVQHATAQVRDFDGGCGRLALTHQQGTKEKNCCDNLHYSCSIPELRLSECFYGWLRIGWFLHPSCSTAIATFLYS